MGPPRLPSPEYVSGLQVCHTLSGIQREHKYPFCSDPLFHVFPLLKRFSPCLTSRLAVKHFVIATTPHVLNMYIMGLCMASYRKFRLHQSRMPAAKGFAALVLITIRGVFPVQPLRPGSCLYSVCSSSCPSKVMRKATFPPALPEMVFPVPELRHGTMVKILTRCIVTSVLYYSN